jgi:hypothetical protein
MEIMEKPMFKMPHLRPIRLPTKGLSWWKAAWVWLMTTRQYEVTENWFFYLKKYKIWVMIPKGFVFDGASVPRIFRMFFTPAGILFLPGLIHDYGYRYGFIFGNEFSNGNPDAYYVFKYFSFFDRTDWDDLFKEVAIQVNGMKALMYLPYWAVLVGGGFVWKKHRKADK